MEGKIANIWYFRVYVAIVLSEIFFRVRDSFRV